MEIYSLICFKCWSQFTIAWGCLYYENITNLSYFLHSYYPNQRAGEFIMYRNLQRPFSVMQ